MIDIAEERNFAAVAQRLMRRAVGTRANAAEIVRNYNASLPESMRLVRTDLGLEPLRPEDEVDLVRKLKMEIGGDHIDQSGNERLVKHLRRIADQTSTHGEPVLGNDMDYAVAILEGGVLLGSGVLIAPSVVLTAAHVANSSMAQPGVAVGNVLPEVDAELSKGAPVPHRDNQHDAGLHDIGLILLEAALTTPSPVGIASTDEINAADRCVVAGFGEMLGKDAGVKRKADLLLLRCDETNHVRYGCHRGRELIAAHLIDGSRRKDSGGPLLIPTEDGLKLAGITSRQADASFLPQEPDRKQWIELYVRVDQYLPWINSVLVEKGVALLSKTASAENHFI
jgi:hypothetical protein